MSILRRLLTRRRKADPDPSPPSPPSADESAGDPDERSAHAPAAERAAATAPESGQARSEEGAGDPENPEAEPPPPPPTPLTLDDYNLRDAPEEWLPLGKRAPDELSDARLQLHHLVQILAAFGGTFAEAEEDDSHRAATWTPEMGGFQSRVAEIAGPVSMVVCPFPLQIQIRAGGDLHRYVLPGHTLGEAWDWAERELAALLGRSDVELQRPEFEIPDHRVAHHALFDANPSALEELSRWYDDASIILGRVQRECPEEASPIRSWPHHFDIATLLDFGSGPDGEPRTIGVGLSPGDDGRNEPYLYVAPWPRPETTPNEELPAGCWQELGWVGAILPGGELVPGSGPEQEARARAFVDAALTQARELLA